MSPRLLYSKIPSTAGAIYLTFVIITPKLHVVFKYVDYTRRTDGSARLHGPDENLKEFLETPGNKSRHEAHTCVLCHV